MGFYYSLGYKCISLLSFKGLSLCCVRVAGFGFTAGFVLPLTCSHLYVQTHESLGSNLSLLEDLNAWKQQVGHQQCLMVTGFLCTSLTAPMLIYHQLPTPVTF